MPLVIAGATSGSTTIQATDAVTATITLPSTSGTVQLTGGAVTTTGINVAVGNAVLSQDIVTITGGGSSGNFKGLLVKSYSGDEIFAVNNLNYNVSMGAVAGNLKTGSTISVGNATPSASGAGITFPATQSASTDANTLDDYEEGTWTGAITTTGGSVTIGSQTCTYVKVGRLVVLNGNISVSAISSPTGQCTITGLPFTPASSVVGGSTVMLANANITTATAVYSEISNTPRIYIAKTTVLSSVTDAADLIGATTFIRFSATYQI